MKSSRGKVVVGVVKTQDPVSLTQTFDTIRYSTLLNEKAELSQRLPCDAPNIWVP